jgi:hypothetical protein
MTRQDEGPMAYTGRFTPHDVACTKCGAPVGYLCQHRFTRKPRSGVHNERWNAAVALSEAWDRRKA